MHTEFWWGNVKDRDSREDMGLCRKIVLKLILKKWDMRAWTGFVWLRIGTCGALIRTLKNEI
jgi:hypothetical protein